MKKAILLLMCLPILFTMGFVKKGERELVLTSVETTVINTERILRYDFKLKILAHNVYMELLTTLGNMHMVWK